MTLSEATQAYQVYLEGHRLDPDNAELYEDLQKAKRVMEIAWMSHIKTTA